jgi:ELWxxDGT repeat protein
MLAVQLVADLNPNTLGSEPEEFVSSGSIAYFGARVGGVNSLWKSDGTPAGTVRVRDNLGTSTYPRNIAIVGPKVYFAANADSATGEEPWVSDGTAAGTVPIKDLKQGPGGSEPGEFTAVGDPAAGRAVFYAKGPDRWEPYVTDGTPAGTFQLADINPGPADSLSSAFTRFGQQVIFTANDAAGRGVWKTDGTPGGTVKVASGVGGTSYTEFNGALYFQGSSLSNPNAFVLWRTNGTPAGTVPVLAPDGPPWGIGAFNVSGGSLWFAGSDDPNFTSGDWWRSDGTAAGTVKAIDLPASSRIGTVLQPTWDGHYLFFTWNSDNADNEVWWTDGTTAGSHIIKVFKPLDGSYHVDGGFGFRVFDNHRVMFLARDAEHGKDFWVTDGTPEGTVPLDFVPGPAPAPPPTTCPAAPCGSATSSCSRRRPPRATPSRTSPTAPPPARESWRRSTPCPPAASSTARSCASAAARSSAPTTSSISPTARRATSSRSAT